MANDLRAADLAIGIDFGGSGIKGAVVNIRTGEFVGERIRIPTPQPSLPREVVAVIETLVNRRLEALVAADHGLTEGELRQIPVGVGIPAATRDGTVLTAANIDAAW